MMNAVISGLQQIKHRSLCLPIFFMIVSVYLSSIDIICKLIQESPPLPAGYHNDFILKTLQTDVIASIIPILAPLPFSGTYVDDIKSKYARLLIFRTSINTYLISRILLCFFLGGTVIILGTIIAWIASFLVFFPMETSAEEIIDSAVCLQKTFILLFINGGLWATIGMSMSTLMESQYIAYSSPFIFYYLLLILCERYFVNLFLQSPKNWINLSSYWPYDFWGPAIIMIELATIFTCVYTVCAGRRLQEL